MNTVADMNEKTSNIKEINIPIPPVIMRGFLKSQVISFSLLIMLTSFAIFLGKIYDIFDLWAERTNKELMFCEAKT